MTKERIQDFTRRIAFANKTEMIVILYDIAIEYIEDAVYSLEAGKKDEFRNDIVKAKNTVSELMNSLDTSAEPGMILLNLYVFCKKELTHGFTMFDGKSLDTVAGILKELRGVYEELSRKDNSGAVMEHAEAVYTGFTYNRNSLQDNFSNLDLGRGFLV